jgi:hypothetical protein
VASKWRARRIMMRAVLTGICLYALRVLVMK